MCDNTIEFYCALHDFWCGAVSFLLELLNQELDQAIHYPEGRPQ